MRKVQQTIIDALDQGTSVHILGNNGNHTDLRVQLYKLKDPKKETILKTAWQMLTSQWEKFLHHRFWKERTGFFM